MLLIMNRCSNCAVLAGYWRRLWSHFFGERFNCEARGRGGDLKGGSYERNALFVIVQIHDYINSSENLTKECCIKRSE
jgi:hypothetical protein